jgi:hypothetical protein
MYKGGYSFALIYFERGKPGAQPVGVAKVGAVV